MFFSGKIKINAQEAVLFQCGTYFMEIIGEGQAEEVELFTFHLYPEILKELYKVSEGVEGVEGFEGFRGY